MQGNFKERRAAKVFVRIKQNAHHPRRDLNSRLSGTPFILTMFVIIT